METNFRNYALSSNIQAHTNLFDEKVMYMIQSVNLPGISMSHIEVPSKFGMLPVQNDVNTYDAITMSIMLDEKLEIYSSLIKIAQTYQVPGHSKNIIDEPRTLYLHVYNNNNKKLFSLLFHDVLLSNIGGVDYTHNSPNTELSIPVTLKYSYFEPVEL